MDFVQNYRNSKPEAILYWKILPQIIIKSQQTLQSLTISPECTWSVNSFPLLQTSKLLIHTLQNKFNQSVHC